jgi:hypothetical protein
MSVGAGPVRVGTSYRGSRRRGEWSFPFAFFVLVLVVAGLVLLLAGYLLVLLVKLVAALYRATFGQRQSRSRPRAGSTAAHAVIVQALASDTARAAMAATKQAAADAQEAEARRLAASALVLKTRRAHGWRRWIYGPLQPINTTRK